MLDTQVRGRQPLGRRDIKRGALRQPKEVLDVAPPHDVLVAACRKPLEGVLADRLQHQDPVVIAADQARGRQRCDSLGRRPAHLLGGPERASGREDGKAGEELVLVVAEE